MLSGAVEEIHSLHNAHRLEKGSEGKHCFLTVQRTKARGRVLVLQPCYRIHPGLSPKFKSSRRPKPATPEMIAATLDKLDENGLSD
jgi:hypothetical protein